MLEFTFCLYLFFLMLIKHGYMLCEYQRVASFKVHGVSISARSKKRLPWSWLFASQVLVLFLLSIDKKRGPDMSQNIFVFSSNYMFQSFDNGDFPYMKEGSSLVYLWVKGTSRDREWYRERRDWGTKVNMTRICVMLRGWIFILDYIALKIFYSSFLLFN